MTSDIKSNKSTTTYPFITCVDPEGRTGGLDPHEKSQKYRVS